MIEASMQYVADKYGPAIQALEAQISSEEGIPYIPYRPLTKEQHQCALFGHLFAGVDQPLNFSVGL